MTTKGLAQRLFLVVLGGRIDGCHIEQHDVRFVAGAKIEDTIVQLREQWCGRRRGLHIDSWVVVEAVAGWQVELKLEPFKGPQRLWFVNGGGYKQGQMAELHEFALLVATSPQAARARGKRALLRGALQRHMDDLRVIQTLANGLHVHLHAPVGARDGGSGGVEDIQLLIPSWFGYKRID